MPAGSKSTIVVVAFMNLSRNFSRDLVCCGEAGTAAETQAIVTKQRPDLLILDFRLRSSDGLELIKSLKAQYPGLRILVISAHDAPLYAERTLRAGALGYIVKEQAADELLKAIRTVLAGEVYLTRGMAALLLHKFVGPGPRPPKNGTEPLSDRELHVLELLGVGMSTREIAVSLSLSFKTIETHRENIKRKLNIRGANALIHYATEWARQQASLSAEEAKNALTPPHASSSPLKPPPPSPPEPPQGA